MFSSGFLDYPYLKCEPWAAACVLPGSWLDCRYLRHQPDPLNQNLFWKDPLGFPGSPVAKNPPANAGDLGLIPG